MEQELMDFDEWIQIQESTPTEYYAIFNDTGAVISVLPHKGNIDLSDKIKIEEEDAQSILTGRESLFSYRVDLPTRKFYKLSKFATHNLTKIDDVLHRIIDKQWSDIQHPDVLIQYIQQDSELIFSIDPKHTKFIWSGETEMIFLITGYNDPNILLQMISLRIGDLIEKPKHVKIGSLDKFSIYTRRIFDNYVMEKL